MSQLNFDAAAARAIEAIYLTPDVVAQRARVIDLLAPTFGERLLDVGVGPGLLAQDLSRLVGEAGRLVGLDLAPAMVAAASARLADLPQAEVRIGDAAALDLPDCAFDAAARHRSMNMSPTCLARCQNCIECFGPAAGL